MKIGILTFHRAHNYGAMLQAFALSQTLTSLGHTVEFVDYRQPQVEEAFRLVSFGPYRKAALINKFKILVSRLLTFGRRYRRSSSFRKFARHHLPVSARYIPGGSFKTQYDALVFGSDQIWTTRFLKDFDPVLWGEVDIVCKGKISYAPSMEMSELTDAQEEFCRAHLKNFDKISVREDRMKTLLRPLTDKDIAVVADPVFLRNKEDYLNLASKSTLSLPPHYVLVYTIGHPKEWMEDIIRRTSDRLGLPVVYLRGDIGKTTGSHRLSTAGPEDFLKAFAEADFIVTSTFHGTAFSTLFEKPFYSLKQAGISGRAESLLSRLGLGRTLISCADEADTAGYLPIDYVAVRRELDSLRATSLSYLTEALNDIDNNSGI